MQVLWLSMDDDLGRWAAAIERASWEDDDDDDAGDDGYSEESLRRYLAHPDAWFVLAHQDGEVWGIASGSIQRKPYGDERWCYVDEVDTAVNHQRKGVATALMREILASAKRSGCGVLWVGTEVDNHRAAGLYRGVGGSEDEVLGYTFELSEQAVASPHRTG